MGKRLIGNRRMHQPGFESHVRTIREPICASKYCVWYQNSMRSDRPECNQSVERRTVGSPQDTGDALGPIKDGWDAKRASVRIRPILRVLAKGVGRYPTAPTALDHATKGTPGQGTAGQGPSPGRGAMVAESLSPCQRGIGVPIATVGIQPILRALTKGPSDRWSRRRFLRKHLREHCPKRAPYLTDGPQSPATVHSTTKGR